MIMRKMISSIIFLLLGLFSCNKNCNDCGPISSARYFIKNGSGENLKLVFYGDSSVLKNDTLSLNNSESISFLYFSTGSPAQSALSFDYNLCDSIKITSNFGVKSMSKNLENCNDLNNVMCTSLYTMTKLDEVKKGKNKGDKYSEYELILK